MNMCAQVDLGIRPLGHQQLLLQAISRLKSAPTTAATVPNDGQWHSAMVQARCAPC